MAHHAVAIVDTRRTEDVLGRPLVIFLREVDNYLLDLAVSADKVFTGMWQQRENIGGH